MIHAMVLSAAAGVLGTGLGGLIGILFLQASSRILPGLIAFAAGIMSGVAAFELIPEALHLLSVWNTVLGVGAGAVLVLLLQLPVEHILPSQHTYQERGLMRCGLMMFTAIGLHNLPEGLAIGAGSGHDTAMGLSLALLIALHDVPEGMSIAVPLYAGGMGKGKAFLFTALSGLPTLLGGAMGAVFGTVSARAVAFALAGAGGAMLYVTFAELLPAAAQKDRRTGSLITLTGMMAGLIAVVLAT